MLLDQLAEERGGWDEHGVKAAVCEIVGLRDSVLSKLLRDPTRGFSQDAITNAIAALNLDAMYFYARSLPYGEHYSAYLASANGDPPFWEEFLRRYSRVGQLSAEQTDQVRAMAFAGRVTLRGWEDIVPLADWLLLRQLA